MLSTVFLLGQFSMIYRGHGLALDGVITVLGGLSGHFVIMFQVWHSYFY